MENSSKSNLEKFELIWEALLEVDKKKFVQIIFETQDKKSQDSLIELAATLGVDRIYINKEKKKKEGDKNVKQ